MAKVIDCEPFERLAFVSAIREHPGEKSTQLAYTDWLVERGYKPIGAKRIVTQLVREATDEWLAKRVQEWLNGDGVDSMTVRRYVRECFSFHIMFVNGIEVAASGEPPHIIDRYSAKVNGIEVHTVVYPAMSTRTGPPTDPRIVRTIGVGVRWILRLCEDSSIHIPTLASQGGPYA